jgi:two-component system response regulator DesR
LLALEDDIEVLGKVTHGDDSLARVRRLRPDILLTDIEMPGLSGIDVAAAIDAEGLPTRTIVVTTFGRPGYLARARSAGVRGYLLKDAPFEELLSSIRTVAGGGEAVSPALAAASQDVDFDPLNDRERDVLRLAEQGLTNRDIASRLGLAMGTIRNYLSEASAKLNAGNRIDAYRIARNNGWL